MDIKHLLLSSLIGAVVIAALANTPLLNLVNCLLYLGFWGGAFLAAWIYGHLTGYLTIGRGIAVGVLAGAFATFIGYQLDLLGLAHAHGFFYTLRHLLPAGITLNMLPASGFALAQNNLFGFFTYLVWGVIGGLLGGAIFRSPQKTI
jgi:hypothetical protein